MEWLPVPLKITLAPLLFKKLPLFIKLVLSRTSVPLLMTCAPAPIFNCAFMVNDPASNKKVNSCFIFLVYQQIFTVCYSFIELKKPKVTPG
jgi:hypothetical protein